MLQAVLLSVPPPTATAASVHALLDTFLTVIRYQLPSMSAHGRKVPPSLCAVKGLSPSSKLALQYAVPVVVVVAMGLLLLLQFVTRIQWCWGARRRHHPSTRRRSSSSGMNGALAAALLESGSPQQGLERASSSLNSGLGNTALSRSKSEYGLWGDASSMPNNAAMLGSVAYVVLLSYNALLSATFALLHCVHVPGQPLHHTYMFIDATTRCTMTGWRLFLAIVAAVLIAMPLVLLCYLRKLRHTKSYLMAAQYRVFAGLFRGKHFYWEAVLLFHRVALLCLATFAVNDIVRGLASFLVCLVALAAHIHFRPIREAGVHGLQTLLLLCLVVTTVTTIPPSLEQVSNNNLASGGGDGGRHAADEMTALLQLLFAYLVPLLSVLGLFAFRYVFKRMGRAAQSTPPTMDLSMPGQASPRRSPGRHPRRS